MRTINKARCWVKPVARLKKIYTALFFGTSDSTEYWVEPVFMVAFLLLTMNHIPHNGDISLALSAQVGAIPNARSTGMTILTRSNDFSRSRIRQTTKVVTTDQKAVVITSMISDTNPPSPTGSAVMSPTIPPPNSTEETPSQPPIARVDVFTQALIVMLLLLLCMIFGMLVRFKTKLTRNQQQWAESVAKLTEAISHLKSHHQEVITELSATQAKTMADLRSNNQQLIAELTATLQNRREVDSSAGLADAKALSSPTSPSPSLPPLKKGFIAAVTRSKGESEESNQDAYHTHQAQTYRLIAVADGVGAGQYSKIASQTVVRYFQQYIEQGIEGGSDLPLGFSRQAKQEQPFYLEVRKKIKEELEKQGLPLNQAATTFIGLIEYANEYLLTYLGDGSVYCLTQQTDTHQFKAIQLMLNNSSLQQPHQIWATGQSQAGETMLISKTKGKPLMWVIATDGMNDLAWDERLIDKRAAEKLAREVWQTYQQASGQFSEEAIKEVLMRWLKRCQRTDDATIALLISDEMYAHWQKLGPQTRASSSRRRVRYGE